MESILEKAKPVRLVIFDVDGVMTAGALHYGSSGIESKLFHVHDGQGIKLLQQTGVQVGIITKCKSDIVKRRMSDLGIKHVYQGQDDKLLAYEDIKQKLQLSDKEIAYVGDDVPDLPLLNRAGLAITVVNAPKIMQQYVHWVTKKKGGNGAVREICDLIMQAQGTFQTVIDMYLKGNHRVDA